MPRTIKDPKPRALQILKSYLEATGVPLAEENSKDLDLVILDTDGNPVGIKLQNTEADGIYLNPTDLASPKLSKSLEVFHTLTEFAGYGKPTPVDRGQKPENRVSYHNEFEDVYLRHAQLRRAPNPKDWSKVEALLPVIKRAANNALYRFKNVLKPMGFDLPDLINIGKVHTISFMHQHQIDDPKQNAGLLGSYLNQRFAELAKITSKKSSSWMMATQNPVPDMSFEEFLEIVDLEGEERADVDYSEGDHQIVLNGQKCTLTINNTGFDTVMYINGRLLTSSEIIDIQKKFNSGEIQLLPEVSTEPAVDQAKVDSRKLLISKLESMPVPERSKLLAQMALGKDQQPEIRAAARKICNEMICPKCEKKIYSGQVCLDCNVNVKSRFGVDFVEVKKQLAPKIKCKSCGIDNPVRNVQNSGCQHLISMVVLPEVYGMVDTDTVDLSVNDSQSHRPEVTDQKVEIKATKGEIDKKIAEMSKALMDSLPPTITCPKCKKLLPKTAFGIRVAKDKMTGLPQRALRQSYCGPCRSSKG